MLACMPGMRDSQATVARTAAAPAATWLSSRPPALPPSCPVCRAFSLAQLVLQGALGWSCAFDLPFCFLLQTMALVAFNKASQSALGVQRAAAAGCLRRQESRVLQHIAHPFPVPKCPPASSPLHCTALAALYCTALCCCRCVLPSTLCGTFRSSRWYCQTCRRHTTRCAPAAACCLPFT